MNERLEVYQGRFFGYNAAGELVPISAVYDMA